MKKLAFELARRARLRSPMSRPCLCEGALPSPASKNSPKTFAFCLHMLLHASKAFEGTSSCEGAEGADGISTSEAYEGTEGTKGTSASEGTQGRWRACSLDERDGIRAE